MAPTVQIGAQALSLQRAFGRALPFRGLEHVHVATGHGFSKRDAAKWARHRGASPDGIRCNRAISAACMRIETPGAASSRWRAIARNEPVGHVVGRCPETILAGFMKRVLRIRSCRFTMPEADLQHAVAMAVLKIICTREDGPP
jgi:hypothetical protein